MTRNIFDSCYKKKRYFDISMVNFDSTNMNGTCKLNYDDTVYHMVWQIEQYPAEVPMPGAPQPYVVVYTIYNDCKKSMTGRIQYNINSGTLPNYCDMGIVKGKYLSIAHNNVTGNLLNIEFFLEDNYKEIAIWKC